MSIKPPPITKSKSVIITGALSIFSLLYKAVDAAGNAEFVWQKLGLSENAARFLGSPHAIDFMVAISLLGLVVSLLYQTNRNMALGVPEAPVAAGNAKTQAPTENRRVVIDASPEYLMKLCEGRTSIQARKSVELYIGKWMRIAGTVSDANEYDDFFSVSLKNKEGKSILAYFRKEYDRVSVLRPGDQIVVMGEIETITATHIGLEKCELLAGDSGKPAED